MKITHQQIAEEVGVSRTVVTEALHRSPRARINPQTRHEILRIARQRGYAPRNLTTHNIGYVQSAELLRVDAEADSVVEFEAGLRERGYRLTLASPDESECAVLREVLNAKTVDGVIFARWYGGVVKTILPPQVPWVLISDEDGVGPEVDLIALDAFETARRLAEYVIGYGHSRLCLVMGRTDIKFYRDMVEGARAAMRAAGLEKARLKLVKMTSNIESIPPQLLQVMQTTDAPTAFIAITPGQAITTLYTLCRAGYRVPDDVSVVAMFNNERYRALPPVLTATDARGAAFVAQVTARLMQKIHTPQPPQRVLVPGEIIERDSVAAPKRSFRKP